jgi:predicted N-formylglutamate amidohydrolase
MWPQHRCGVISVEASRRGVGRLLGEGDPEPVIVSNPGFAGPCVIVCDHAGRAIPASLGRLGLPDEAFDQHIAWDIGAGAVGLFLGEILGAPVVRQAYSRLVVDCNRAPGRPDTIVEMSDGVTITGNVGLSRAEAQQRLHEIHAPYHAKIAEVLDARRAAGVHGVILSIHSFTPRMNGHDRPWRFGVLHEGDSPLSKAMLETLRAEPDLMVGDNEPYAMDGIDYTVPLHARGRGLDYLELEIRQDLISELEGQEQVASFLAPQIQKALGQSGVV